MSDPTFTDAAREAAITAMRESLRYRADVPDWLPGHMLDAIPQSVLAALAAASQETVIWEGETGYAGCCEHHSQVPMLNVDVRTRVRVVVVKE